MTQILRSIRPVFFAIALGFSALSPAMSGAQGQGADQALVTVRFNQPRIYFDQQLYSAVSKAVAVKPEVVFDVVSYAPSVGEAVADKQWQTVAGRNTRAVIASMNGMGVPMSRIHVTGQSQAGLRYDETRIFVR